MLLQILDADTFHGGDGEEFGELEELAEMVENREDLALVLQRIDLVEDRNHGRAVFAENTNGVGILVGNALGGIDDVDQEVALFERAAHGVHHPLVDGGIGFVDTRGVNEVDLRIVLRPHALDGGAGCLGLVRDNRDLLADERIEEGGLARIRAAQY